MQKKWPEKKDDEFTLSEAAEFCGVTTHAIHFAIRRRRLAAKKERLSPKRITWIVKKEDLEKYRKSRFDRKLSMHNGEPIFDNSRGLYSAKETAEILNCKISDLYYLLRRGKIKSHRSGTKNTIWVIHVDDIIDFKEKQAYECIGD